jgi:hypothetical protein
MCIWMIFIAENDVWSQYSTSFNNIADIFAWPENYYLKIIIFLLIIFLRNALISHF